jgi:hypothetical protein
MIETATAPAAPSPVSPQWVPPVATPGPETAALRRFHFDCTWTGTVEPNMMGPGSPRMSAMGRATFVWTDDGLWLRGEFTQDQHVDGLAILTWKAHYLIGWDPVARDYIAFLADNCGHAGFMRGLIEDDRLVLMSSANEPVVFRATWDLSDPTAPIWIDELSVSGGPWQLIEHYTLVPVINGNSTLTMSEKEEPRCDPSAPELTRPWP